LKGTTTGSVNIAMQTDRSQLSDALQNFASSYNTLSTQLIGQIGPSAGALSGDSLIRDISSDMQQLATYWDSSGSRIRSLSDLGIEFETTGQITFNQDIFDNLTDAQISDAFKFIGSAKSGLANLASNFTQFTDPITGVIRTEEDSLDTANS